MFQGRWLADTVDGMTRPLLTYDTATAEQVAEARAEARRKLAEARERCTPEVWERIRAKYGVREVTA